MGGRKIIAGGELCVFRQNKRSEVKCEINNTKKMTNETEIKPKESIWGKPWLWIIAVLIIIIIALPDGGEKKETLPLITPPSNTVTSVLDVGEEGILNNNSDKNDTSGIVILATDEKAFDDFSQALIANDKYRFNEMINNGRLFTVPNGTAVKVTDIKFPGRTNVRVLEGKYVGESGWIAFEFIISK